MRVYCAYCKKLISNDNEPDWGLISHGICSDCYAIESEKLDKEFLEVIHDKKREKKEEES